MREILFRAKRLSDGEWVQGCFCPKNSKGDIPCIIVYNGGMAGYWFEVDPKTVGQFTGLTDKNGKKIFEHDICRNTRNGEIVLVKWHGTMAGYVWCKHGESCLSDFGELFRAYDKYEVIGNVHDNPELLRGNNLENH